MTDTLTPGATPAPMNPTTPTTPAAAPPPDPRRWRALVFIGMAQLMVVLDGTIMNIALPSAQRSLHFSDSSRQWLITGYALAFGSLLLLGGRIADYTGRKRALTIGLLGFAGASAIGGAAPTFTVLLVARCLQGSFGALLAPAALSLLATTFVDPRERAKAFGVFGALAGGGNAIGLLLGGFLTEYLDWRWCLYVNIPIAAVAVAGGSRFIRESRAAERTRFDLLGVVLVVGGLVSVVYGLGQAATDGWGSATVLGCLIGGAVLLALFVVAETRVAAPTLPLRILLSRTRASAYLAVGFAGMGMFSLFLFMTYYMQQVKGYSAVVTGVAFLPMTVAIMVSAVGLATRLVPRVAPRLLMAPGLLCAAAGLALMTTVKADTSYVGSVLPVEVLAGFGIGFVMAPAMNYATRAVAVRDTGVASAMVSTSQQIFAAIGTALTNTVAASATAAYLVAHRPMPGAGAAVPKAAGAAAGAGHGPSKALLNDAVVHGFASASGIASVILAVGAGLIAVLMNTGRPARITDTTATTGAAGPGAADAVVVHIG